MSLYKYNITVKVDDEDDKYNEMTIRLGIKNAVDKYNNLSNENNYIMSYLLRGGYIG